MIQLAWRFLMFQKDSALAHWFYARTKNAPQTRKTMIVALARKLLIALWRRAREGAIPEGIRSERHLSVAALADGVSARRAKGVECHARTQHCRRGRAAA